MIIQGIKEIKLSEHNCKVWFFYNEFDSAASKAN